MGYKLIIVESPGKVKSIGKFLGKNYHVRASSGHIRDLPKSKMGIDLKNNFEPQYITIRGKGDLLASLKKEAKGADQIFLATDPDREGEAISWHLAAILGIDDEHTSRITFNEITKNAVKAALKSPRSIDKNLVDAQQARRILDRIVGYKISPILWRKVKKGLSAGRVQSVALKLICDRDEEIDKFVPEEYWNITASLSKQKHKSVFKAKFYGEGKKKIDLKKKEQVDIILNNIKGKDFIVEKVKKGERKRQSSPPFITSTLQQEASKRLGFTTKKTMMLAQQLYEGVEIKGEGTIGLITYMRTDSTRLSSEAVDEARNLIVEKFGKDYLPSAPKVYKTKSGSQDAHEAIRPSSATFEPEKIKASLSRDQFRLYKMIWERFMACQMNPAIYDTLNIDIRCENYLFKASGSKIKFKGYMALYQDDQDKDDDNESSINNNLPEIISTEKLDLKEINEEQSFTQPPARYTEASLVKVLEEKGIGRPSTYAPTIGTLISRYYVIRESKQIYPTDLGKIVNDIMKNHFENIVNVEFTADMESQLDKVEEGSRNWKDILADFYGGFEETVQKADEAIGHVEVPDEVTDVICDKCGRNMVIKNGRYGKFLACPGFPECRNTKPIVEQAGVKCPKCGKEVIVRKTKKGRKYYGCEGYPECDFISWDKPAGKNCPKCSSYMVEKGYGSNMTIRCSNNKCNYIEK